MRRATKLAAAAARSRRAIPARISSGSGIDSAFDGPSQSIAFWIGPLRLGGGGATLVPLPPPVLLLLLLEPPPLEVLPPPELLLAPPPPPPPPRS